MLMEFFIGMRIANAVSDPDRVALLERLASGETAAESLLDHVNGSREALLAQLAVLTDARLVESRTDGLSVLYRLAPESRGILKNLLGDRAHSTTLSPDRPARRILTEEGRMAHTIS